MKAILDKFPVSEDSKRHLDLDSLDAGLPKGKTEYKRFRRRANRDRVQLAFPNTSIATSDQNLPMIRSNSANSLRPVTTQVDLTQRWHALRPVTIGGPMTFNRYDLASRAFDQLRTQLLQTLRLNSWSRIAIAAPTPGCGSTFTAVNLGLSFARVPGSRILVMDLNLRAPGIATALGVNCSSDMRGLLSGKIDPSQYLVLAKSTLAFGLASEGDQDTAELLCHQRTSTVLKGMNDRLCPDVTIYDLPPILAYDDLTAFLPQVDGVLLVSDGTKTSAAQIKACERALQGRTNLLGVVLNQVQSRNAQSYVG